MSELRIIERTRKPSSRPTKITKSTLQSFEDDDEALEEEEEEEEEKEDRWSEEESEVSKGK